MKVLVEVLVFMMVTSVVYAQSGTDPVTAIEPVSRGLVARAQFSSAIVDREPVDNVVAFNNTNSKIYFFTELRNLKGQTVTHRWEYNDEVVAEVRFNIGSNRWRVYSSKTLVPSMVGTWTVVVTDESGWPLKATIFEYTDGETKVVTD